MAIRPVVLAVLAAIWYLAAPMSAEAQSVSGRIVDPSGLALPGVAVTLHRANGATLSTTTDSNGEFSLADVPSGRYDLEAVLDDFEPAVRRDLDVAQSPVTLALQLALAKIRQDVTVSAPTSVDVIGSPQPGSPTSVTREVMDVAMLPNSQIDDVLPLMPNVVRGPDGLIAVAGARSTSTGLYVDGRDSRDPIQGGAGMVLPLEAVDTMHVYTGGAPAEFGGATGGVTSVVTRSGTDRLRMSVDSFFPRLLYDDGLTGVAFWDPNVGFGGPIVRGHVTVQQSISYRYDRNTFTTLAGPDHNVFQALLSWTQVDARISDTQHVRVSVGADPRGTDRANITAFTPADATPRVEQGGWSAGVSDAIAVKHLFLELRADALDTHVGVEPHGTDAYLMAHDLVHGSYFDTQDRRATRLEGGARLTWSPSSAHTVTGGASLATANLDQLVQGQTIQQLGSDGVLVRTIGFLPSPEASVGSTLVSAFVQDRWNARPWLALDAGVRVDAATGSSNAPLAPRVGWTVGRDGGRTTIGGSAGLFTETLPLSALAFNSLPARRIMTYDALGLAATTNTLLNETASYLDDMNALRWDVELNRRAGAWLFRFRYEQRRGRHELVVTPGAAADDPSATLSATTLSSTGTSQARSLETTAGYRGLGGAEWYVSYVRAATSGAQNSLDATEGVMRAPFVQAVGYGPLLADVPHRVLAWGVLHLPGRFTVAPFLEMRSGFPYTAIDDRWVMVGAPNAYRLPPAATLDLSATRVFGLPHHLPDARVGLKLYNIASAHTDREVQTDVARSDFGTRYDPLLRDFSIVFELLWGHQRN